MQTINQIVDSLTTSVNSIIIDYDSFKVSFDDISELSKKVKRIFIISERTLYVNQFRIKFRMNRDILSTFKLAMKSDITISIDLLVSNNVDSMIEDYIEYNKDIKLIYSEKDLSLFGFNKKSDTIYEKNIENTLVNDFYIKVKQIHPIENSYSDDESKYEVENKKSVIYTCITGKYDVLFPPRIIDTRTFDYICFTNCEMKEVFPWKIINLKETQDAMRLDDALFSRFVKMKPHEFLKDYEMSIWIDGNVSIVGELKNFIKYLNDKNYILTFAHQKRTSAFSEIEHCKIKTPDERYNLNRINKYLISNQYFNDFRLAQTNVLLRKHLTKKCISIMNRWWEMTKTFTKCDQTTFNYVMDELGGKYLSVNWDLANKMYFLCNFMHGGRK